ncbi:hypothetical protein GYB60_00610, partial [bacterium]|nr:hypothetical protein [bacterium]
MFIRERLKVVWNTVPLPAEPHLAGDLDNWTLAYAIHQAFDRAFNALKLGMPDLVRPIPLVRTPDRALFETIWNLPQGTTYEKVMKQAEGIAEKIDAPWLRIGRRTHDSDGRVLPDTAISICFGHHPDTVEVDPRTRAFLESLDLHAAFYALKLGAPVLEEAVRLTKPGRPAITEAKFRLSASIDWAAVSKKTAALAEKIEVDYLRITRRDDPSGNPSPLVSVIYGCHPTDTVMLGDPAGYDPDEPLVGPETNSDRLFLDALDWDDYFRPCGLVGSDRRSPAVISKTVNKQGVASYECRTVPGLPISDLVDGVEALKATSGLGYVEIESHPKDAALFKLLAAKIDPLDRPYLAVDYANGPKPHTNTTVLHAPVPGVPDIDWAVGPGAEGDLLIDKWEGDNPHLFIGGASGSGKALALDTLIPTPDGERKFGDLRPGDRVFDETGRPCRVVGLSPTWVDRPTFEVEFDDGTVIVADAEHEWVVDDTASRANAARAEHRTQVTDDDWGPTAADAIRAMKSSDGRLVTLADFIDEVGHAGAVRAAVKGAGIEATPLTRKVRYRLTFRSRTVPGYDRDALLDIWADRVERSSNAYARPQKRNASKRTVTTAQMAARVLDRNGKRIWSIDVADPLELPDADLPVDPYLLGILLGDGGLTNPAAPDFTTADPEIVDYVRAALPEDATLSQATEYRWNIVREGARPDSAVTQWLRAIGLTA